MHREDVDALLLTLSSEVALVCDSSGIVRWVDVRGQRLLRAHPESAFVALAAPGSEAKAQSLVEAACNEATDVWELVVVINTEPVVMTWRGAPFLDGAVLVGNLMHHRYAVLHEQMAGVVGDLMVLQRETERQRRQLADAQQEKEWLLASERAARAEADSARERAEDANRTRDLFLRTLAHDLKAPLVSLSWHVQLLHRKLRGGNVEPSSMANTVDSIQVSAAEAISGIDELHDLARIAEGARLHLQREQVDLVPFVQSIVRSRLDWRTRALVFETALTTLRIDIDAARLARAIRNLIDNADKYSPMDQPVTVSLRQVLRDGGAWAAISVRDRGIGIPEVDLPHVFQAFFRGTNVETTSGQGLGLASVHNVVELHGGYVDVASQQGAGSVFTLWLPGTSSDGTSC